MEKTNLLKKTKLQIKSISDTFVSENIKKFKRERNAFIACDLVINVLAGGEKEIAHQMAETLVMENTKDPVSPRFDDAKSRKINLVYSLCLNQLEA